ncbi:MAG: hypothetical protein B7X06_03930, partial [Verrucomicrobia bacterium 21-51-4]
MSTILLLREGIIFYLVLIVSLCLHEWGHAWIADKLGDPLPRVQGRVTLNPLVHMDLIGSVLLPLAIIFLPVLTGGAYSWGMMPLFAWGKPVELSLPHPKTRVRDEICIAAAGPAVNLILCLVFAGIGSLASLWKPDFTQLFAFMIFINASLAVFNLLPIPPLDGGQLARHAMRLSDETYAFLSRWSLLIIILIINIPVARIVLLKAILAVASPCIQLMTVL